MRGLCGFFLQRSHENYKPANIFNYRNPTLAKLQVIHNRTYEAYLAVSMLLSLDHSMYENIIKDLPNSYSMGIDQYPQTRANMHDTIIHWQNRASCYRLQLPPAPSSSRMKKTTTRPMAKHTPIIAIGSLETSASSSASDARNLAIFPTSALMGPRSERHIQTSSPRKHLMTTCTDSCPPSRYTLMLITF